MIFKLNYPVTTALATLGLTTGLGLVSSSANAFTFTLNQSSGTWSNVFDGYDEWEGVNTVDFQTIGKENRVRWGTPADSTSGQSGLGFTGAGGSTRQLGEPFLLGTLRHLNNPIYGGTGAEFVDLTINLDFTINPNSSQSNHLAKSFAFTLGIDETLNTKIIQKDQNGTLIEDTVDLIPRSALQPWIEGENCKYPGITSCPDRIFPQTTIPQDSVNIEGTNYTLEWIGFSNNSLRPLIIPGLTEEKQENAAKLYVFGRIVETGNKSPGIFPGGSLTVNEGDWFNFGAAEDSISDSRNFAWDLDADGNYNDFTGSTGTWSFADNGINTIGLRVSDNNSIFDSSALVTVNNVNPTLTSFDLSHSTLLEGESASVLLTATDPGADAISFLLNNNLITTDNNTSGTRQANLDLGVFADDGTFTYTGIAEDKDGGRSESITKTLTVLNVAPSITSLTKNILLKEGELFNFAATATDPGINDILTYDWDLNNDGIYDDFTGNSGEWSFANNSFNTIGLRVSDGDGGFDFGQFKVTVENVAPTITSLTDNLTVWQNELFDFAATGTDPGINDILTYRWDLNNDGVYDDFTGNSGQWSFANPGIYNVGVRIEDSDGGFDHHYFEVTAKKVPESSSALGILGLATVCIGFLRKYKT
jgi:hypothetical protein